MRQTNLSAEELLALLGKDVSKPNCFYINELGIIFYQEGSAAAEKALQGILESKTAGQNERYVAFCWLSSVEELKPEIIKALESFKREPENKVLVARSQIEIPMTMAQLKRS